MARRALWVRLLVVFATILASGAAGAVTVPPEGACPPYPLETAPFLDGSEIYQRMEVPWTYDPWLYEFLFVYRHKGWSGWE